MKGGTTDQQQHPEVHTKPIRRAVLTIDGIPADEILNRIRVGELEAYVLTGGQKVDAIEFADCPASPAITLEKAQSPAPPGGGYAAVPAHSKGGRRLLPRLPADHLPDDQGGQAQGLPSRPSDPERPGSSCQLHIGLSFDVVITP